MSNLMNIDAALIKMVDEKKPLIMEIKPEHRKVRGHDFGKKTHITAEQVYDLLYQEDENEMDRLLKIYEVNTMPEIKAKDPDAPKKRCCML